MFDLKDRVDRADLYPIPTQSHLCSGGSAGEILVESQQIQRIEINVVDSSRRIGGSEQGVGSCDPSLDFYQV